MFGSPCSILDRAELYPGADPANWREGRAALRTRIAPYLGEPCEETPFDRHSVRIVEERSHEFGTAQKVAYDVEPGETVHAWLLVPHGLRGPAPAILTLHETNPAAKDSMLWPVTKPFRDLAAYFCRLGFVTFSPDHLAAGERAPPEGTRAFDTTAFYRRHPGWSAVGKMIWDGRCALDVLGAMPGVDPARIGVAGHSLGGYGSFILAAYDERLVAAASSCGMAIWEGNPEGRLGFARDHWYIHFPALRPLFMEDRPLPFELYEIAALAAPRPFLNITAMQDRTYGTNEHVPEAGRRLAGLHRRLGNPEGFANLLMGGGHDLTGYFPVLHPG